MTDDLTIPKFLRHPGPSTLGKHEAASGGYVHPGALLASGADKGPNSVPFQKPKGMSMDEWNEREAQRAAERKAKLEERLAVIREDKANRLPPPDPLKGLVPLRAVLASLATAPSYKAAQTAVDASSLVHTRYYFEPGTVEAVQKLLKALPPAKVVGVPKPTEVPPGTIKLLIKDNPRRAGSAAATRFDLLMKHNGKTTAAFMAAGGNSETLINAIAAKRVEVK